MNVVWSPRALQRATEAVDFIAKDRPQAATAWLEQLLARISALDRLAKRGRIVPEINRPEYREILHAPYRVIYRVDGKRVVVLTIRHARRAWDTAEITDG
ncbi:MAG: type II toxin-antitoxin system RelE/ParE family toxin [Gemmatimonadetes bacterium]|nr:type II toxin-antitoxin system RelE/ParE family toxin [Gemmatimonadota bacterium]